MTVIIYVPFCAEYYWTFLITVITSIFAIHIEDKYENPNQKLYMLFFISGICTNFFDFLTTEELPILVPVLIILGLRHSKKESIKEMLKFVVTSMAIWFVGYCAMWISKWILASLILKINAFDYVKDEALFRMNGNFEKNKRFKMYRRTLKLNVEALYPICFIREKYLILIPIIYLMFFLPLKKKSKDLKILVPLLLIGLVPYLRYFVLLQHSFAHFAFTFRLQFATIMSLVMIMGYCTDKNIINKKVGFKNKL